MAQNDNHYEASQASPAADAPWPGKRGTKQIRRCPHCGQCFSKTEHLARHIRSHTKERPFRCDQCGRSYSRQDSLLRHARGHCREQDERPTGTSASSGHRPSLSIPDEALLSDGHSLADATAAPEGSSPAHGHSQSYGSAHGDAMISLDAHIEPLSLGTHAGVPTPPVDSSGGFAFPSSILNTPADLDFINMGLNATTEPAWMIGSDFDLNALNLSVSTAIAAAEWRQPFHYGAPPAQLFPTPATPAANNRWGDAQTNAAPDASSTVQASWFTSLPSDTVSHTATDLDEVDDEYREGLSNTLQRPPSYGTLPSADFLNLCIKLYFSKFNRIFPIIHAATFRPSSEKALLLLSVCSMGAIFVGTTAAAAQGRKIFVMLNKAILTSWDNYIRRDSREVLSLVQAAVIGQTFGMLSGNPSDLCLTESFHGTVIAWARRAGFFKTRRAPPDGCMTPMSMASGGGPAHAGSHGESDASWRSWAHTEEAMRVVLALYIHDAAFATIFHHEPLLRHGKEGRLPVCSTDELLHASNIGEWNALMSQEAERAGTPAAAQARPQLPFEGVSPGNTSDDVSVGAGRTAVQARVSHMYQYAVLSGILGSIEEKVPCDRDAIESFRNILLAWHADYSNHVRGSQAFHVSLMTMWHAGFMMLYANLELLERAVGRDGQGAAEQARDKARDWAASCAGRQAVLHAVTVLHAVEPWPIGDEPAMHVPKTIFNAGIIVYNYLALRPLPAAGKKGRAGATGTYTPLLQHGGDVPELKVSGLLEEIHGRLGGSSVRFPPDASILCGAIDLLHRIGHWGIAQKLSSILETLLDDLAMHGGP